MRTVEEHDALVIGGLVSLLLLLPLGAFVHTSPRFPGSILGTIVGGLGAILMLVPLLYVLIKRLSPVRKFVTSFIPLRTLLTAHIYAGVLGPILGVLHSAHRSGSTVGVLLLGVLLSVVVSGYAGRYLLGRITLSIAGQKRDLAFLSERLATLANDGPVDRLPAETRKVAYAVAATDSAIRSEEQARYLFSCWHRVHIVIAAALYIVLGIHIWGGLYYGLRWLK
ncbi:hypothetical protein [Phreatobacter oligotrophus]|jgi:hypothetical protein|uniref:hypothetical protein n=1 Tax=Phreatobacter oligotrophus TaxID=1122261 RepID=UPI000D361443|nr:hypothetical protein [Phreatobacter oligotrophus]